MELFSVPLAAGAVPVAFPITGRYARILDAVAPVKVVTDTGINSQILPGLGGDLSEASTGRHFQRISFASDIAQTVQVLVSAFPVTDNRIVGDVNALLSARTDLVPLPVLDFVSAGSQTIAGNSGRGRLDLLAGPGNTGTIWIGGTAAGEGIPLTARGAYQVEVTGDLVCYGDTAGDKLHVVEVV